MIINIIKMLTYLTFISRYQNIKNLDPQLPDNIKITTITILVNLKNIVFNIKNIADYIKLSKNFIQVIKYGNSIDSYRSIIKTKTKKKNNRKRQNFYSQTTLIIENKKNNIKLNLKLFGNGKIQITGAKNISSVFWCIYKIFKLINYAEKENDIKLFENTNSEALGLITSKHSLTIRNIDTFKIVMINCVYEFDFKINRNILFENLLNDGFDVLYDSSRHAGINLKHYDLDNKNEINNSKYKNRYVSMLIFEKGKILFSGAINYKDIMACYKFLNLYLINSYLNDRSGNLLIK